VKVINPFKTKEATRIVKEALQVDGPSVIVFRAPCTLLVLRERRKKEIKVKPVKVTQDCDNCMACVKITGCPALTPKDGKLTVNEVLCATCTLCVSVCPHNGLKVGDSQ
jgi:indolepyruvate ferredoxin oxidoreductase alpha subunit